MADFVEVTVVLERLERAGRLTPENVIEEATDENSPLHDHFTWNDKLAGEKLRLIEARTLIRRVKIEVVHRDMPLDVIRFVVDPAEPGNYRDIMHIRHSEEDVARRIMMAEMEKVARAAKRARNVAAVLGSITDIEEIIRITTTVQRRIDLNNDQPHGEA